MDSGRLHFVIVVALALIATVKIMDMVRDIGGEQASAPVVETASAAPAKGALAEAKASRDKLVEALK